MSNIQSEKGVNVGKNTPIDYVLAGTGGLLGGPVGVGLSILVLYLIAPHAGAQQKWFVWLLCGCLGVPLSWGITATIVPTSNPSTPQQEEIQNQGQKRSFKDQVRL